MAPVKTNSRSAVASTITHAGEGATTSRGKYRVLVVDAEAKASRAVSDAVVVHEDREVLTAKSISEAKQILVTERVSLLVIDLKLPDGNGLSLVPELRKNSPDAGVVVTAKSPKLEDAIECFRSGAGDFIAKPFTREMISERIETAILRQDSLGKHARKIERLRGAVRRLSEARRTIARKVDLLCNDLVGAYGELSRQVDSVRTQEDFRKLCDRSKDLEQLLCHTMDWIMRRVGYSNIAVYLAADDASATGGGFQLGAYVKYTMPSSSELTDSIRDGLVARAGREGFVKLSADEANNQLSAAELRHLRGQAIVAANCTYLGESLATVVLFRDGASPFTVEDAETFRAIAPIFAIALAGQVRGGDPDETSAEEGHFADGEATDSEEKPKKNRDDRSDADWWKRGEAPPF